MGELEDPKRGIITTGLLSNTVQICTYIHTCTHKRSHPFHSKFKKKKPSHQPTRQIRHLVRNKWYPFRSV